jgi:hypothetical protein
MKLLKRLTQTLLTFKYYIEGFHKFKYPLYAFMYPTHSIWAHNFARKFIASEEDSAQFKASARYFISIRTSEGGEFRIHPVFTDASYTGNVLELQFYSHLYTALRSSPNPRPRSHFLPMFVASLMHILPPLLKSLKPGYIYVAHVYKPLNKWYLRAFIHLLGVQQIHFTDNSSSFLYAK